MASESALQNGQQASTVELHVLRAGNLTLPERFFVHPSSQTARRTVPSLSFLVQHTHPVSKRITRIVFDLGLRRDVSRYMESIQTHAATRQPISTDPDVTKSLAAGGLTPHDIDYVVFSHVHWDHVGEPRDFPQSTFVVGYGALDLLRGTSSPLRGSHSFFELDLLPESRTLELPDRRQTYERGGAPKPAADIGQPDFQQPWAPRGCLPAVIDVFRDGSVLIVDSPGHLPGHVNLLARTGATTQVYLAGDACHDRRIMRKERAIGEWLDGEGRTCCIHADRKQAELTIERIRRLEREGVEIIFAHDDEFEADRRHRRRFFGAGSSSSL